MVEEMIGFEGVHYFELGGLLVRWVGNLKIIVI